MTKLSRWVIYRRVSDWLHLTHESSSSHQTLSEENMMSQLNVLWSHSKSKNCGLIQQTRMVLWMKSWWVHSVFNFTEAIQQARPVHCYIHIYSSMVSCLVLLINPSTHIDFVHRALVVACIHGCCSWNVVQHIVNVTWSPWASVAVCIMSLLNARNCILINPLMWCLLFQLFLLDAKHKDPSFWDCHRSLQNLQTQ